MDLGVVGGANKRLDAIKLAKGSKWDELKRLVDAEPLTAQQTDSYGMLPLHWACTEPHSIGEGVLMALLKAYPQGARAANTAEMLPLQIAIKAQAKIEWIQALLASYPDAVLKKTPTGENALELARKANLPSRSVRLLEEMYHHVCQKAGYSSDHLYEDDDHHQHPHAQMQQLQPDHPPLGDIAAQNAYAMGQGSSRGLPAGAGAGGVTFAVGTRATARRPSNPDPYKQRTFSDNDYPATVPSMDAAAYAQQAYTRGASISSNGSGSGSVSISKPMPYQVSAQLSQRTVVSLPPRWTNAPNCHICSQKWSTFRKRHHCRNCGQSICGDHSARERMRLPHYGLPDKYRVCTVCHHMLRNAATEMLQPSQARLTAHTLPNRRSDEHAAVGALPRRESAGQIGATSPNTFQLERHVSAPARSAVGMDYHQHQGIHDQVASLQKQVSQLMEEKEFAENQLRAQAELLGGDPMYMERLTGQAGGVGRRERLNSVPLKLPSAAPLAMNVPPMGATTQSYGASQHISGMAGSYNSFDIGSRMTRSTASSAEELPQHEFDGNYIGPASIGSAVPEPPTSTESGPVDAMVRLQEDLGKMSFMSSYSEFDDRSTEVYVDDVSGSAGFNYPTDTLINESEEDDATYDDDDGDEGDSTLPEVEVLVNLGLSMLNKGSASAAVQAFTRAIEICPGQAVLYSYLAKAFYADENLDAAVEALETSLELEPSAANSTLLGKILFEKGDHEKAIIAYQKSLEIQNA